MVAAAIRIIDVNSAKPFPASGLLGVRWLNLILRFLAVIMGISKRRWGSHAGSSLLDGVKLVLRHDIEHTVCSHGGSSDFALHIHGTKELLLLAMSEDEQLTVIVADVDLAVDPVR